jgi:hypothetical protein
MGTPRLALVGDHDRVLCLRPVAVAAEASAQVAEMQMHVLFGDAGDLCRAEPGFLRALIAEPDVHAVVGDQHRRVAWLHASSREIGCRVRRLDDFRRPREGCLDIAVIDTHAAGLIQRGQKCRVHVRGVECRVLGWNLPLNRHLVERGLRLVPAVGDDGDAAAEDAAASQRRIGNRKLHGRTHARHRSNLLEVVRLHVAAVDRARLHRRPFHAGHPHIDPVDDLAGHLERHVEVLLLGAHQRPLIGRLDRDALGMRMWCLRCVMGDLPVGRLTTARGVRNDAVLCGQFCDRHVPLFRGCEQ